MSLTASIIRPSVFRRVTIGTENRADSCCASMPGIDIVQTRYWRGIGLCVRCGSISEVLMLRCKLFGRLLVVLAVASAMPGLVEARDVPVAKNVVLVHGLYADGSSWMDVIPYLQRAGLNVTAVQNPLTSLADDVAATRRVLASQDGPTVLVGHSFAGTIISEAGNDPKVSALVYVAARAPDAGEDFGALAATYPKPPASAGVIKKDGFFWLSEEAFLR